jgi:tripartite-type tricarboxylate transporter receptor subunit TctC
LPHNTTKEGVVTTLIRGLVAVLLLVGAGEVMAQTYPSRTIRMIVPFAAGGPTDVIARIVAQKLSETWGQQIYAENIPGGGGNTGIAMAARAPADGYTILVVSTRLHRQSQSVCEGALRSDQGLRADHAGGILAQRAVGQS